MPVRVARSAALHVLPLCLAAGLAATAWAQPAPAASPAPEKPTKPEAAAPADPADLGRGLRYLRPAAKLDAAALTAATAAPALVLDLRSAGDDAATVDLLGTLLPQRDTQRPLLILLGPATPAALRAALPAAAPGVVTLAAKDAGCAASILVAIDLAQDRAALEALAAGRPPRELIEEKVEKRRYDEARLAHDHANGVNERERATEPTPTKTDAEAAKPAPAQPQDTLLQRAVFLHRALLALGRIPAHT